ncbi:MAG: hypothetical protein ACJ73S_13320 [Mycobacteriales bacterium]
MEIRRAADATITKYTPFELVRLVRWTCSDGPLRDDEKLLWHLMDDLGFQRRDRLIDQHLRAAIARHRQSGGS